MSLLEDLPIELVERTISMFLQNASLVEALRALNTCKTFRNLIFHHIIEKMPRKKFITLRDQDKRIVQPFLSENLEVLLRRRSKSQNIFEWISKPLFDAFTFILKREGCSIQDDRGKVFEETLITHLVTLAKHWTIQRLIQRPPNWHHSYYLKEQSTISTAIIIGKMEISKKPLESQNMYAFLHYRLGLLHQHARHWDVRAPIEDPMHPIVAAIYTEKMEILQFLLKEMFDRPIGRLSDSDRVYSILRLVIKTTNTQAITLAHDQLNDFMIDHGETKYFDLITLAATTGDIATFRTVIHLYANQFKDSGRNSTYARACRKAHEDILWSILKSALLHLNVASYQYDATRKDDIKCLIGFIMIHYDTILMETAFSSPKTLVPVWKNKTPTKQDRVDRSPLLIEQALIIAGSQPVPKTTYCETISKKKDHALLACGASMPPYF